MIHSKSLSCESSFIFDVDDVSGVACTLSSSSDCYTETFLAYLPCFEQIEPRLCDLRAVCVCISLPINFPICEEIFIINFLCMS
jgi:hypothetical protein